MAQPLPTQHSRVLTLHVADDDEAREIARTLNADRRHLTVEQRREVVAVMAAAREPDGTTRMHSPNAIAGALGVALSTVQEDEAELTAAGKLEPAERVRGLDGKSRPARKAKDCGRAGNLVASWWRPEMGKADCRTAISSASPRRPARAGLNSAIGCDLLSDTARRN